MQGTVTKKRKLNSDNSETQSRKKYKKKARIQQPADEQRLQVELETLNEQLAKIEEQMKQKKEEIEAELGNDVIAIDDDITPNQGEDTTEGVERRSGRSVRPKRASRPTRQFAELEVGEGAVGKTGPVPSTATKTNVASPQQQQQPRSRYQPVYDPPKWDRILPVVEKSIPKKVKNLWGKSPMIVCKNILKELLNQKNSYWFAEPVDPVALNIPDYFDIIKKPMDLGTINKRMSTYTTVLDFANDVRLVISNALSYNAPGHEVYLAAQSLSKFFEKSIKRAFDMEKETPDLKKQQLERDVRTLKSEKSKLVKQLSQLKETKPSARLDTEVVDESPLIKPKDEVETSPMNYGERCQLCNAINGLQDKYMRGLVTIVADENPVLLKAGVSELDIDTLSTILLRRMEAYIDSCKAKDVEILNKAKNVQEKKGEDMTESKNHQPQSPVTLVKEESSSSSSSSSSDSSSDSDEDEDLPISNKPVLMMQSTPGNNGASLLESNKPDSIGASVGSPVLKEPGFHNQPVKEEKKVEVLNVDAWSSLEKEGSMFAESHDGKQTSGGSQGGMINGQSPAWSDFKRRKEENEKRVKELQQQEAALQMQLKLKEEETKRHLQLEAEARKLEEEKRREAERLERERERQEREQEMERRRELERQRLEQMAGTQSVNLLSQSTMMADFEKSFGGGSWGMSNYLGQFKPRDDD